VVVAVAVEGVALVDAVLEVKCLFLARRYRGQDARC
jgi:hypothetical protein